MYNAQFAIVMILATAGSCLAQGVPASSHRVSTAIRPNAVWPGLYDQVVKAIPYTADALTESTQTFADGSRVVTKQTTAIARDSMGRTRREETLSFSGSSAAGGSEKVVHLDDPVAQVNYLLTSSDRVAHKILRPQTSAAATRLATPTGGRGPGVPFQSAGRPIFARLGASGESRQEQLGIRTIGGLTADGVRTTTTIRAGQIGNDRPIEITEERWYSSQLKLILLAKRMDSRVGETVYRLINIQLTEPPISLFEIPSDYGLQEDR